MSNLHFNVVVVHEHLPKPLSTHYNGNFDDEPEFRSLELPLQSLKPAGNFEVSGGGGAMDDFPPTCPVVSTHPLSCASPGTLFATVHRTDSLIRSPLSSPLNSSLQCTICYVNVLTY